MAFHNTEYMIASNEWAFKIIGHIPEILKKSPGPGFQKNNPPSLTEGANGR